MPSIAAVACALVGVVVAGVLGVMGVYHVDEGHVGVLYFGGALRDGILADPGELCNTP